MNAWFWRLVFLTHHYLLCYIPNSKSKFGSDCELWRVSPWLHVDAAIWSLAFFQEAVLAYLRFPGCSSTMWSKWIGLYLQLLGEQVRFPKLKFGSWNEMKNLIINFWTPLYVRSNPLLINETQNMRFLTF